MAATPPSANAAWLAFAPPDARTTAERSADAQNEPEAPTPPPALELEPDPSGPPPADADSPRTPSSAREVAAPSLPVQPHDHDHDHRHEHADAHDHPHEHTAAGTSRTRSTRVPARMSPLQRAGWWTLLGGFVLTGTAATLAGVTAREQGRRRLLVLQADPPAEGPVRKTAEQDRAEADIERSRARGRAYSRSAIAVGSVAGAALLAGVIVLVVDVASRRRSASARRADVGVTGIEVRF